MKAKTNSRPKIIEQQMHKIYYKDFISVIILNKIITKAITNFFSRVLGYLLTK